jgi:uncharacterized iron-regulated membrane protein
MGYFHKPQAVWWRKALFQVHLWVGIIIGLYIIVIGITGSILVFKTELATLSYPQLLKAQPEHMQPEATLAQVVDHARAAYPQHALITAYRPGTFSETFLMFMESEKSPQPWLYVFANPDGTIRGALNLKSSWLTYVGELHYRLLAGQTGFLINGIGAGFLVLLSMTGLVLWWPGIHRWTRALKVNFRRNWKRINFDLHSVIGFWTVTIVLIWAISGVYFVWPKQVESVVNRISSTTAGTEPEIEVPPAVAGKSADIGTIIAQAQAASPGNQLAGIYLPEDPKKPFDVMLARGPIGDFTQMDHIYFDPSSGKQLGVWHSGINPTLGSKFVFWLGPLHFGVYWGLGIKILWAVLGLSLPVLTVTGALMYWNRSLRRYWRKLRGKDKHSLQLPEEMAQVS